MSDDAGDRAFGLIAAAEDQQKVVAAVLARLAAQEDALARERQLLAEDRAALRAEIAALRQTTGTVGTALQRSTQDAVVIAVAESMAGARPARRRGGGGAGGGDLAPAGGGVGNIAAAWVAAVAAMVLLMVVLANLSIGWWDGRAIAADRAQKALLEAQIAEMQDVRDALVQAGVLAQIDRCEWACVNQ